MALASFLQATEQKLAQGPDAGAPALDGVKILIVDDSKTIRHTVKALLKKTGCEIISAADGFEALAKVVDFHPDIIFIDIMMPRLDGYQTCALIKQNKTYKDIPVVLLSSKDGLFDRARGRVFGSEQYLTKPFTSDELVNTAKTLLHGAEQSA